MPPVVTVLTLGDWVGVVILTGSCVFMATLAAVLVWDQRQWRRKRAKAREALGEETHVAYGVTLEPSATPYAYDGVGRKIRPDHPALPLPRAQVMVVRLPVDVDRMAPGDMRVIEHGGSDDPEMPLLVFAGDDTLVASMQPGEKATFVARRRTRFKPGDQDGAEPEIYIVWDRQP
jgi:hypothetical protein